MGQLAPFAQALKRYRKACDLTQHELAERVGCAVVTIQRIEQGTLRPSRQITQRLAQVLTLPTDEAAAFVRLARGEHLAGAPSPAPASAPQLRAQDACSHHL